ncbi:hypothetical protein NDU88_000685 [Pleurodeles waltl]|uniref:Uncharacterized protein n=1 Tax=Pleurodeles waltl TaxID=8319 RepID=A0AAV7U4Y4_PLEWA|nr:hypothetical protein NDU88_000685 [Pleurodeles waltl]
MRTLESSHTILYRMTYMSVSDEDSHNCGPYMEAAACSNGGPRVSGRQARCPKVSGNWGLATTLWQALAVQKRLRRSIKVDGFWDFNMGDRKRKTGKYKRMPRCHDPVACVLHMFWSCPQQIMGTLVERAQRTDIHTAEGDLMGLFHRSKRAAVTGRFIDLALILGRRAIATSWKSPTLPTLPHWGAASLKWGRAEAAALQREEARGLRRVPIAST